MSGQSKGVGPRPENMPVDSSIGARLKDRRAGDDEIITDGEQERMMSYDRNRRLPFSGENLRTLRHLSRLGVLYCAGPSEGITRRRAWSVSEW
jgi:hypothetical protein